MSHLIRIAHKFASILKKSDEHDPLLKHPGQVEQYIDPEMTEELDEIVKDSLHLVILMQRVFMDFGQTCEMAAGEKRELGCKLAEQVLFELQDIETNLQDPHLLEFVLNTESGILDTIAESVAMIAMVLNLVRPATEKMPEAFKDLDQRVFKWLDELKENITKIADQSMGQSEFMERHFAVEPMGMKEQVDTDVDQILEEDIHPDHPSFQPELETWHRENEQDEDDELEINPAGTGYGPLSRDWTEDKESKKYDDSFNWKEKKSISSQFYDANVLIKKK